MNIGVAWKKTSQAGKNYMSCVLQSPFLPGGEIRFAIFAVDEKKSANSPDYNLVWNLRKQDNAGQTGQADQAPPPGDDDIPF